MTKVRVIDSMETQNLLAGNRLGRDTKHAAVVDALMQVLDTKASVYVEDYNESDLNTLRTRMDRHRVRIKIRRVVKDGVKAHIIYAERRPE
jgi:alpha-D-ribose 1-methylphosphonate 5-triphosphate synthase subunit PhnG